jgi:hypothetical protein
MMEWLNGLSSNSGTTLMMWMVMVLILNSQGQGTGIYTARDKGQGTRDKEQPRE